MIHILRVELQSVKLIMHSRNYLLFKDIYSLMLNFNAFKDFISWIMIWISMIESSTEHHYQRIFVGSMLGCNDPSWSLWVDQWWKNLGKKAFQVVT